MRPNDIIIDDQVRQDIGDLAPLTASIASIGIINPIVVETKEGKCHLVAGERRLRAALSLGLADVPTTEKGTDVSVVEVQVAENLHRKQFTPLEEAQAVLALSDEYTQKQIESVTGIPSKRQTEMKKLVKAVNERVDEADLATLNLFTESAIEDVLGARLDVEGEAAIAVRGELIHLIAKGNHNVYSAQSKLRQDSKAERWTNVIVPAIASLRDEGVRELETKKNQYGYDNAAPKIGHQARVLTTAEAKKHTKEKCFAFWTDKDSKQFALYCTNWLLHAEGGKSDLVEKSATQDKELKESNRVFNAEQRQKTSAKLEAERRFVEGKRNAKTIADWAYHLAARMDYYAWQNLGKVLGLPGDDRNQAGVTIYCEEAKLDVNRVVIAYQVVHSVRDYKPTEKTGVKAEVSKEYEAELKQVLNGLEVVAKLKEKGEVK